MRLKPKARTEEVERIKGLSSLELTDRCPDQRKVFPATPCANATCAWAVGDERYMNCTFVVAQAAHESGRGLSLEEIGEALGVSRERIRQIEKAGLANLRNGLKTLGTGGAEFGRLGEADDPLLESGVAAGPSRFSAFGEDAELPDPSDFIHPGGYRSLG